MKLLILLKVWIALSQPMQMQIARELAIKYHQKYYWCQKVNIQAIRNCDFIQLEATCGGVGC